MIQVQTALLFVLTMAIVLPLALLVEGLRRKLTARMQNRIGPGIFQPIYDFVKLWSKEDFKIDDLVYNLMPVVSIAAAFSLFVFIPFSFLSFEFDFLVIGFLFILFDAFLLLAGFASRSGFAFHSAIRALLLMLSYEFALISLITLFFTKADVISLLFYNSDLMFLQMPIASVLLLIVGLVVVNITPYDVAAAEPEISSGLFTEFFGKKLAMLEAGELVRDFAFIILASLLIFGKTFLIPGVILLTIFYSLSLVTTPRFSTFRTARTFIIVAIVSLIDFVFLL